MRPTRSPGEFPRVATEPSFAAPLPSQVACVVSWREGKRAWLHLCSARYLREQLFLELCRLRLQLRELLQLALRDGLRGRLPREHQIRVPVAVGLRVSLGAVNRFAMVAIVRMFAGGNRSYLDSEPNQ